MYKNTGKASRWFFYIMVGFEFTNLPPEEGVIMRNVGGRLRFLFFSPVVKFLECPPLKSNSASEWGYFRVQSVEFHF